MQKSKLKHSLLLTSLLAPWAQALALDAIPSVPPMVAPIVQEKHIIPKAIQVELTSKGASFFERNLMNVINNMGISIDEGYYFYDKPYLKNFDEEFILDKLNVDPDTLKIVTTIRDTLRDWFVGYEAKAIKPSIQIAGVNYQAIFKKFSIMANPDNLKVINKKSGAILTFDAELQELDIRVAKIRAWDQNAIDLGQVGFDNFDLKVGGKNSPVQIRMSFYVSINPDGIPEFEIVDAVQNFDQVVLKPISYDLITPAVGIIINGKTYPFNKGHLEQEFASKLPAVMVQIREFLHTFASDKAPGLLNDLAKQNLVKSLEEIQAFAAPGGVPGRDKPFQWGLQLKELSQNDNIRLTLDTFIEDEQNPKSKPDTARFAKMPPLLNTIPQDQFDLAVGVDLAMINRSLQLSFERRLFEKIPLDTPPAKPEKCPTKPSKKGDFLHLTEAPRIAPIDYRGLPAAGWGEAYAKVKIGVQVPVGTVVGWDRLAIDDNFIMNIDLIVKIKKGSYGKGLTAQLWGADPNSIRVDDKYLTWIGSGFRGKVLGSIADKFRDLAKDWQCNQTAIAEDIAIPNSILGVETDLKHIVTEPTGFIVLYLNFKERTGSTQ